MNTFCPLIREECKHAECMAWKENRCLVFSFLASSVQATEQQLARNQSIEESHVEIDQTEEKVQKAIEVLRSSTPEELVAQLVSFVKKESEGEDNIWVSHFVDAFWAERGIEKWDMPSDLKFKVEKVELLAQQEIDGYEEMEMEKKRQREKIEFPALVSQCVNWAREHGLKRLTQADIEAFLLEKELDISVTTERSLYATANVQLKSTKK
jgi:hypothetical protein